MDHSEPIFKESSRSLYLSRGIYSPAEAARLLKRSQSRIDGWTRPRRGRPPLLTGQVSGLFDFWDLLSLRVIAELAQRGVPHAHIARGADHLAGALGTNRPFAHKGLATVGVSFFAEVAGGWEDVGLRGQLAFQGMISPLLEPITFAESEMASIWRPHLGVWINPTMREGTPCVDGTRIPTGYLAERLDLEDPDEDDVVAACRELRLTPAQIRAALNYEYDLAA